MGKHEKRRLDDHLVAIGLADSTNAARALIMSGDVIVDDQRIDKPGIKVSLNSQIRLRDEGRFVSRGGEKLFSAIEDLSLKDEFKGKTALDVGASTGGFTDCLLSIGAEHVTALDVGTAQLAWKLRLDPRVTCIEKTDIKQFQAESLTAFDWVVADLSFTSLAKMIPEIRRVAPHAKLLLLIKPQFELPRHLIPEGGVITNHEDRTLAITMVEEACQRHGLTVCKTLDAKITGRQGNQETFIFCVPNAT